MECRAATIGVGTYLIWTWCTVGFELEPTLDSRITLCVRRKPPSSSLYTIAKSLRAQKSPRYNRFLVIYDFVITDICSVYLDTIPNFSTKFARYIRLLVITGLVIYDFYCIPNTLACGIYGNPDVLFPNSYVCLRRGPCTAHRPAPLSLGAALRGGPSDKMGFSVFGKTIYGKTASYSVSVSCAVQDAQLLSFTYHDTDDK